ncbi:tetratricopeptide repeat protein, partial [Allosphingosinicella sp.]|uniref:tetratricopeptide repeat protein n=1 Tax=Allosphingosinicella sp. TaxID=2823234 RepID=UPI002F055BB2
PLVGSLAYLLVEMAPGLGQRRAVRMAKTAAIKATDPDREVRSAQDELDTADTAANRIGLADALAEQGKWTESILHYREALAKSPRGDRPTQRKLARAHLEAGDAAEAKRLLETLPKSHSAAEEDRGNLLLARALAELGESGSALALFADLGERMPGGEPLCRQAALLIELGRDSEAVEPLAEAERRARRIDRFEKARDREMYDWAERTLAELRARGR